MNDGAKLTLLGYGQNDDERDDNDFTDTLEYVAMKWLPVRKCELYLEYYWTHRGSQFTNSTYTELNSSKLVDRRYQWLLPGMSCALNKKKDRCGVQYS